MAIIPEAVTAHLTADWERFFYVKSTDELFHFLNPACSTAYGSIVCIVPTHSHIHHQLYVLTASAM